MSLCSPQWLVQNEGASEGLFALCTVYKSFSSCTAFAAWLGKHPLCCEAIFHSFILDSQNCSYSLSWMFLSASCLLSLTALLTVRPALSRGRKAIAALLLNTTSVVLCASSLINFLVSVEEHKPELQQQLGWSFYICCATLFYASVVTMLLGVIHGKKQRQLLCNLLPVILTKHRACSESSKNNCDHFASTIIKLMFEKPLDKMGFCIVFMYCQYFFILTRLN
ncbi:hypothetical protein EXN66_Car009920 [Channa argus]|uniref:Uncharacterized protein n=1 Tax=Channa argus TaxID=215402 RepID=A0A6G1PVS7_CHAAH|nr:hypothetical protein EXN66_Car009920 [Channa argus]